MVNFIKQYVLKSCFFHTYCQPSGPSKKFYARKFLGLKPKTQCIGFDRKS